MAKATRGLGVAALTAGPGVTNGISAIAGAQANNSPIGVLGGRAPEMRWGSGSLQEIDHLPFVSPLVKSAETVKEPGRIAAMTAAALDLAAAAPSGPTFLDYPLDVVFTEAEVEIPALPARAGGASRRRGSRRRRRCWRRPSGRRSWPAPASTGGTARRSCGRWPRRSASRSSSTGSAAAACPADHELAFSRARGTALKGADVALVVGVPMDFRLGFGGSFGEETKIVRLDVAPNALTANRAPDVDLVGDVRASLAAIREAAGGSEPRSGRWLEQLRDGRGGEAGGRAGGAGRPALAAAPGPHLPRAGRGARPRRDRRRRRRRLRLLRRPLHRHLRAGLLDGPGPVRLPRRRARARRSAPRSPIPTARSACCSATAPSASPGWSSTRWRATASAWSG